MSRTLQELGEVLNRLDAECKLYSAKDLGFAAVLKWQADRRVPDHVVLVATGHTPDAAITAVLARVGAA